MSANSRPKLQRVSNLRHYHHLCVQVSSIEIERVCIERVAEVQQAAAIAVPPRGGGPEELHLFVVLNSQHKHTTLASEVLAQLQRGCQVALREHLNPLFKVQGVTVCDALPRNAANKVMRRLLRDKLVDGRQQASKL